MTDVVRYIVHCFLMQLFHYTFNALSRNREHTIKFRRQWTQIIRVCVSFLYRFFFSCNLGIRNIANFVHIIVRQLFEIFLRFKSITTFCENQHKISRCIFSYKKDSLALGGGGLFMGKPCHSLH